MVGVDNMRDFVPERVQHFRSAMLPKRLITDHDPVPGGLIIAAVGFAPRDHNFRRSQSARKMGRVEACELGLQLTDQALNARFRVRHRPSIS